MDAVTSNFIITTIGIAVGSLVTLIGAMSKCMLKSRCTRITCCGAECIRDVINEDNEVYHETSETPK